MGVQLTRRRVIGALVVVVVIGGLAGTVALRAAKKSADAADAKAQTATLEFAAGELALRRVCG